MFQCGADANHTLHRVCLYRYLDEESEKNKAKKAKSSQMMERCVVCYPRNLYLVPLADAKTSKGRQDSSDDGDESDASSRASARITT